LANRLSFADRIAFGNRKNKTLSHQLARKRHHQTSPIKIKVQNNNTGNTVKGPTDNTEELSANTNSYLHR